MRAENTFAHLLASPTAVAADAADHQHDAASAPGRAEITMVTLLAGVPTSACVQIYMLSESVTPPALCSAWAEEVV
jgi:hypothetical protein